MDFQKEVADTITKLWSESFPCVNEADRYVDPDDKKENIKYFVDRFLFCDGLNPKITTFANLTQRDIALIQSLNAMKLEIYQDAKKSKFFKDIEEEYRKVKNN